MCFMQMILWFFCKGTKKNLAGLMSILHVYGSASGQIHSFDKCKFYAGAMSASRILEISRFLGIFAGNLPLLILVSLYLKKMVVSLMLGFQKAHRQKTENMHRLLSYIAQWRSATKEALDRTAITVKFLCWLHVTNNYLCSPTHVYGPSMLPTLNLAGDVILAEHVSPRFGKVGHGDLVLVRSPLNPNRSLTKRVVGMEGDTVTYFDPLLGDATQTVVVPKGHVWIQGDNIYASHDSRHFGPVPYGLIQGKVFFRVWPLDSFGLLGQ